MKDLLIGLNQQLEKLCNLITSSEIRFSLGSMKLKSMSCINYCIKEMDKVIMINAKCYKRLACCWKRTDNVFVKRQKIHTEIERICSENSDISKQEVIETLIADYKGQISNNNFMQFVSLIFSVLVLTLGFVLKESYLTFVFFALIIITLSVTFYCLRYLYAEGFVLHILEEYIKEN